MLEIKTRIEYDRMINLLIALLIFRGKFFALIDMLFQGRYITVQHAFSLVYYSAIFLLLIICLKKFRRINIICVLIYVFICIMAAVTAMLSKETEELYARSNVLTNTLVYCISGIIVFSMVRDYDGLLIIFKNIGYTCVFLSISIIVFSSVGNGYMGFSYSTLFFELLLLHTGLIHHDKKALVFGLLGCAVNVIFGTRGAILCVLFFVLMYFYNYRRFKKVLLFLPLCVFVVIFRSQLIDMVYYFATKLNIPSRTLQTLRGVNTGTGIKSLTDLNGRNLLFRVGYDLIKSQPWGYGFLGERVEYQRYILWFKDETYPHNILLELVLHYGVIFGALFFILIIVFLVRYISKMDHSNSQYSIVICLASYCILLLYSRSYTIVNEFWLLLSMIITNSSHGKHKLVSSSIFK